MRALATRPGRFALGIAVLTAAALGTVSASAAQASGTTSAPTAKKVVTGVSVVQEKGRGKHFKSPKRVGFAVAYHPTTNAPDDLNTANDDFAQCMRDQGQSVFPDFHATKDDQGRVLLQVKVTGGGFDPTSTTYKRAIKKCGPILEKVGITFPNPADLPSLPSDPGKPGDEAPSLHTEGGGKDDGLPGLTTTFKDA